MISEINLLLNFYQTMIWFGKSFIKFCKSFIKFNKFVSTRPELKFRLGSFPTPTQLHLSIFSTVVADFACT